MFTGTTSFWMSYKSKTRPQHVFHSRSLPNGVQLHNLLHLTHIWSTHCSQILQLQIRETQEGFSKRSPIHLESLRHLWSQKSHSMILYYYQTLTFKLVLFLLNFALFARSTVQGNLCASLILGHFHYSTFQQYQSHYKSCNYKKSEISHKENVSLLLKQSLQSLIAEQLFPILSQVSSTTLCDTYAVVR